MRARRRRSARSRAADRKATDVVSGAVAAIVMVQVVALGSWWATMKIVARQVAVAARKESESADSRPHLSLAKAAAMDVASRAKRVFIYGP